MTDYIKCSRDDGSNLSDQSSEAMTDRKFFCATTLAQTSSLRLYAYPAHSGSQSSLLIYFILSPRLSAQIIYCSFWLSEKS